MKLKGKNAVVYGAAGSIATVVSQAFGRAGARIFLCGRTLQPLEALANEIASSGGSADCATLAGLKALLEHNVGLNLVADRFPKGPEEPYPNQ